MSRRPPRWHKPRSTSPRKLPVTDDDAEQSRRLEVWGVDGIGEVNAGDDLAALIAAAAPELVDGDVVVVTSKVVSKAEGRVVSADREAAIDAETVRVVATRGDTRIVETRHGFVLAAAGVDASNVPAGWGVFVLEGPQPSPGRHHRGRPPPPQRGGDG